MRNERRKENEKQPFEIVLEDEKTQFSRNMDLLEKLDAELNRIKFKMGEPYEFGITIGRKVSELASEETRDLDFLFALGQRMMDSFDNEEDRTVAKCFFEYSFPIKYVNHKNHIDSDK